MKRHEANFIDSHCWRLQISWVCSSLFGVVFFFLIVSFVLWEVRVDMLSDRVKYVEMQLFCGPVCAQRICPSNIFEGIASGCFSKLGYPRFSYY